ncbi:2-aminoethylphosphonate--pyruvate transaminase [Pontibacillus salicampi]|uniref:2-aminoethylphosphonate--pyruvate transaminase n=1 Tax=Pontibacillus salicampi TaxID=1449801 RepID=A0ABV6LRM7_9BACI
MCSSVNNPYLLLTPGPLTTTSTVRETMLHDWCTWDEEYKTLVQSIRQSLLQVANVSNEKYTVILMQGSGTYCVESVITSSIPAHGKLLVVMNGAYGERIGTIASSIGINWTSFRTEETHQPDIESLRQVLAADSAITHVAVVHCETTTGMLNPIQEISEVVKEFDKTYIVDAMSSFGGITMDIEQMDIDYVISSANKCIQGVPGFGFIIANRSTLQTCKGQSRSLSLDMYDQWETMEEQEGKWRFTSPTHTVRAFRQALDELQAEGGVSERERRYMENQNTLVRGMRALGFSTLLSDDNQSPIITAFQYPEHSTFSFDAFYNELKSRGFVIYPGKVTNLATFRIGNIGNVHAADIDRLLEAVKESKYWELTTV